MRNDAWWRYIEVQKGVYNFSLMDSWVATVHQTTGDGCASGQIEPMTMHFILEGGNRLYQGDDATPPTTQEAVAAFVRFTVATMSRYAGLGILWEVQNEADIRAWNVSQYAALVIAAGKAVRATPSIASEIIVGPSLSTVNCEWVQSCKDLGALRYVDAVSVHAYCSGAPEQMRWRFDALRKIVGNSTAILSGEWGWGTCTKAGSNTPINCLGGTEPDIVSENDQAMFVARQWLMNALERVPISIYCKHAFHSTFIVSGML